jgi:hypothetical protein
MKNKTNNSGRDTSFKGWGKVLAGVLIILIFIGTFVFLWLKSKPQPTLYEEFVPTQKDLVRTTVVTGKIEPRNEVNVKPQISGIITEIMKEAGDLVQAGEVIAKVKVIPDMQQLSSAQARVRLAQINVEQAKTDYEREKVLFDKGFVSADEFDKLRQTYDGYHFAANSPGVYNPYSIINALSDGTFDNYWFSTGTPSFLVEMLRKFHTDISRIDGSTAEAPEFDAPTEDMRSILPLFYQSGYITIKHFDRKAKLFTLGFPNKEVKTGLMDNLYTYYVAPTLDYRATNIWRISKGLLEDDPETSLQTLQAYLEGIPYQDSRFDENHYTQMLYVIFSLLGLHVDSQVRTAKGRLDVVVRTEGHIYVMEVKLDRPAQEAIEQIDSKNYLLPYSLEGRQLTKIGISFSTEERNVTEWVIG